VISSARGFLPDSTRTFKSENRNAYQFPSSS